MKVFPSNTLPGLPGHSSAQWQSITLAALVHGLLLVFLWVGVQWQSKETTAVEAEVWDMTAREAAPKPVPVELSQPEPEKIRAPVPAKVLPVDEPVEDPEIALAQEKKRKRLEKQKQEVEMKAEHEKALKLEKEILAEQKKKAEKLVAADKAAAEDAEKKKQLVENKQKIKAQQAKEQSAAEKVREDNMRRMTGQASVAGSGGSGDAAKSTGNNRGDPSYAARIAAKVRSNTVFNATDNSSGNPTVEYRIELIPDGSLRGPIRKLKSSGVPGFDEAVEKGIEKSIPFPKDKSGEVPASIVLIYKMKE
jgi:colicin import membrane protein